MKLKNIDWKQLGINAGFAVSFTMTAGIIAAVLTAPTPKPGPTIEEQLKVIQANQQTMTQWCGLLIPFAPIGVPETNSRWTQQTLTSSPAPRGGNDTDRQRKGCV